MADGHEGDKLNQGIRKLREAADLLSGALSPSTDSLDSPSSPNASINSSRSERAVANLRTLFGPYADLPGSCRKPATQSTSQIAAPPRKKGKYVPMFFKPRETWTNDFTCLSYSQQAVAPSKQMKWKLQQAGLGKKRVVFHSKANATQVKRKLEEVYPKLASGCGFEILRRGMSNELVLIEPPPSGYSVTFLRDSADLGQAIAFIRPLQSNLDMTPVAASVNDRSLEVKKGLGLHCF